jgi:Zn-dependent protease
MSLSFLAAGVAVELARLGRFRLWLDASGSRARRPGQWPPHGTGHAANNLLLAPLLVGGSAAMVVSWICLTNAMSCWLPVWGAGAVAALIVGVFALLYGLRCRPVIAATPLECWHRAEIAREC